MNQSNRLTNILILITGPGLIILAISGHFLFERVDLKIGLTAGLPLWIQLSSAVVVTPFLVVYAHSKTSKTRQFDELSRMSHEVIATLNPSLVQIAGLSLAAGIGEELLFRGVVQPLIGIVPSSIIFAGLHTGFRFDKHVLRIYFAMVFILSVFLGLIAHYIGLPAAMAVHAVWDFVMIHCIRYNREADSEYCMQKSGNDET